MAEEEFNIIFSRNLKKYLSINNYTQAELAEKLDVGTSTVSYWCNGTKSPRMDKVDKICSLFNIKRSDLMDDKDNNTDNTLTPKDQKDIAKRLDDTLEALQNPDGLMFDGEVLDEETAALIKSSLENVLTTGKVLAKKKYTPKKYRKDNEE